MNAEHTGRADEGNGSLLTGTLWCFGLLQKDISFLALRKLWARERNRPHQRCNLAESGGSAKAMTSRNDWHGLCDPELMRFSRHGVGQTNEAETNGAPKI